LPVFEGIATLNLNMKIYFITSKLNFLTSGGSIEEFDLMIRTLQKLGNEVVVITAFSNLNKIPLPLPYQVKEEFISGWGLLDLQKGVYRIIKKYESDADFFHIDGHLFLYGAGFYRKIGGKVPISAFFNRELSCWAQNQSTLFGVGKKSLGKYLKEKIRWNIEHFIGMFFASAIDVKSFISPMYQEVYERFGLDCRKQSLILGDPIDFPKLIQENGITEMSYRNRIKKEGPIILFFSSRMAPAKGFDLILAGFARVKNKEHFRLVLGGDGPEKEKIHQLASDLGIMKYIEFTGWMSREKLYEYYKKADVFIQVGWRPEGTSISLLYAMAFGLPSIVPERSGLAWQAGGSALHVINGDHEGLARQIERMGESKELRAELSKNCYARINDDQLNHEKVIGQWFELMRQVKGQKN